LCLSFCLLIGIVIKSTFSKVYPNVFALEIERNGLTCSVLQYARCTSNHLQQVFHRKQKCSCTNLNHLGNKERGYSDKSVLPNGKSCNTLGCRNKRLLAQNTASWNYKFHLETTPEGMRPCWLKNTEMYCGIKYCVKGRLYVHTGGRGGERLFHLKTVSIATFM